MKGIHSKALNHAMMLAISVLKKGSCKNLLFHNYNHTLEVVSYSIEIASRCQLNISQMEPILIAVWLHDLGYSEIYYGHEEFSMQITEDLLTKIKYDPFKLKKVLNSIQATKVPQHPKLIDEKIICDAVLYHLATLKFSV